MENISFAETESNQTSTDCRREQCGQIGSVLTALKGDAQRAR